MLLNIFVERVIFFQESLWIESSKEQHLLEIEKSLMSHLIV